MEIPDKDKILDMLLVSKIGQKALDKVSNYNPNLIANLSKEMHDLYLLRKSICEEIFPIITSQNITLREVKEYIQNQINETHKLLAETKGAEEKKLLRLKIEEFEDLLK